MTSCESQAQEIMKKLKTLEDERYKSNDHYELWKVNSDKYEDYARGLLTAWTSDVKLHAKIKSACSMECYCEDMDENNSELGFTKACNLCWIASMLDTDDKLKDMSILENGGIKI